MLESSWIAARREGFSSLLVRLGEEDKRLHALWSFWLTSGMSLFWPPGWACGIAFLIGLLKECWDHRYGSGFCLFDMLGNLLGIVLAVLLVLLAPPGLYSS